MIDEKADAGSVDGRAGPMIREAFERAALQFVALVDGIPADRWSGPGLDDWTLRDLVGHTSRALSTVEQYLDSPAAAVELQRPIDYYVGLVQRVRVTPEAIGARAREAGGQLGPDPARAVREIAARVVPRVRATPDDAIAGTIAGGIRLIDYLPSRVLELVVHSLDLGLALGRPVEPAPVAAAVTLHLLADLALAPGRAVPLILAATGRRSLPDGYALI